MTAIKYEAFVKAIYGLESKTNYFGKALEVSFNYEPSSQRLYLDNPAYDKIVAFLVDAYITRKRINLISGGSSIVTIDEIPESSDDEKKQQAIKTSLFCFKNDIRRAILTPWEELAGLIPEKKIKRWKVIILHWMHRLEHYGYDPYYLFSPEIVDFWKNYEPNITYFIKEVAKLRDLDLEKIENNLEFKL